MRGSRTCYTEKGDLCDGAFVSYYENGVKEREGFCVRGKPEGEFKVYQKNGKLTLILNFKNGLPEGNTYHYGENGSITLTELYKNGKFVKEVKNN